MVPGSSHPISLIVGGVHLLGADVIPDSQCCRQRAGAAIDGAAAAIGLKRISDRNSSELDVDPQRDAVHCLFIDITVAEPGEGTGRESDCVATNAECHRLRNWIDGHTGSHSESTEESEDPGIRVNRDAAIEAGKRYEWGILNLVRADVALTLPSIRARKEPLIDDDRIGRRSLIGAVRQWNRINRRAVRLECYRLPRPPRCW